MEGKVGKNKGGKAFPCGREEEGVNSVHSRDAKFHENLFSLLRVEMKGRKGGVYWACLSRTPPRPKGTTEPEKTEGERRGLSGMGGD